MVTLTVRMKYLCLIYSSDVNRRKRKLLQESPLWYSRSGETSDKQSCTKSRTLIAQTVESLFEYRESFVEYILGSARIPDSVVGQPFE